MSKLNWEKFKNNTIDINEMALEMNVLSHTINKIINNRSWKIK